MEGIKPGPVAWMVCHPVAANLLMTVLLLGGLFLYTRTTQEVFPEFSLDTVSIRMAYPGASPEEVEQGIVLAIEDAVRDVDGIGEITSTANEGSGSVTIEIVDTGETMRIAQDIKTAVDRITTFPVDAEDLSVGIDSRKSDLMGIAVFGDVSETVLRAAGEAIRDRLEADPAIGFVDLSGVRGYEIHVDVSEGMLRRYGLSIPDIAAKIRQAAVELGGGSLRTKGGEILVRMSERRDRATEFRDIPLITTPDGSRVLLGDIATISEGFQEVNNYASYNGKPAILLNIFRVGDQTPTGVSEAVFRHLEEMNASLPPGLQVAVTSNSADSFRQRADLLARNGIIGFFLVVVSLALFLDARLAFWVSMTIPISFLGAFLFLPMTGFTVNVISMFAFIITLGIVVDDAIVSGENIYSYNQRGFSPRQSAILGAREIAIPVTMSIATNIVAFLPLLFVPGMMGKVFGVIPVVVMATFLVSLIDSIFILPYRLGFPRPEAKPGGAFGRFVAWQQEFSCRFEAFVKTDYLSFLKSVIRHRYLTAALFTAVLLGVGGYVFSGRMGMQLFPRVESDYAFSSVTLEVGASADAVHAAEQRLVAAAKAVIDENGGERLSTGIYSEVRENVIEVRAFLTEPNVRPLSTAVFTNKWREKTGDIIGAKASSFVSNRGGPGSGAALTVELSHADTAVLDLAASGLAAALREFPNVKDIDDGQAQGKRQFGFTMKPLGQTLGFNAQDVGRQVRAAFYGAEALKQQRGRNEVKVVVRLPDDERISEYMLKNMVLRSVSGAEARLGDIVEAKPGRAYTQISRRDGRRVKQVTADVDPPSQAGQVIAVLVKETLPELQQLYPGLSYSFEGRQADMRDSLTTLFWGMGAVLFVMYVLMALMFGGYGQPLMVLLAVPFGAVGAVLGHLLMGYSLSIMSMFGIMALSGVVVNGSIVLIDFSNRRRRAGTPLVESLLDASVHRFRPIMLSNVTTFLGVAPMIFETSRQARFLIPMALSLGFGILLATLVTLILVPALYMILEDIKGYATGARLKVSEGRARKRSY